MKTILFILMVSCLSSFGADHSSFLKALWEVESGGAVNAPAGDNGKALGPFQIWKSYWTDAIRINPSLGGKYEDVNNPDYANQIVVTYLSHYGAKAWSTGNWEVLARIHNGGPKGATKPATVKYWNKVNKVMADNKQFPTKT